MADIIPAIIPQSLTDLEDKATLVASAVDVVQIDVMDGKFVGLKSWPYIRHDDYFEAIVNQEAGLPLWEEVDYEVDLMVANPLNEAIRWTQAGAFRVIAHIEAFPKDDDQELQNFIALKNEFIQVGLAIGIGTPVSRIEPYLKDISCVQCMGIKRIGYQGEPFDDSVLAVIRTIRAKAPELPISVDGGVSLDTAQSLVEAGATHLVSGSAVFESVNPHQAIRELLKSL